VDECKMNSGLPRCADADSMEALPLHPVAFIPLYPRPQETLE